MAITLGERLKKAREAVGLSQSQAAAAVGMAQPTLSQLEQDFYPTSKYIPRLAAIYHVSAIWLADGRGPQRPATGGVELHEPPPPTYSTTDQENDAIGLFRRLTEAQRKEFIELMTVRVEQNEQIIRELGKKARKPSGYTDEGDDEGGLKAG